MRTDVVEVIGSKCVGAISCASARAAGFDFQACSFNHSDISPFKNQRLASGLNQDTQDPLLCISDVTCSTLPIAQRDARHFADAELCQTFECAEIICGDLIKLRVCRKAQRHAY